MATLSVATHANLPSVPRITLPAAVTATTADRPAITEAAEGQPIITAATPE